MKRDTSSSDSGDLIREAMDWLSDGPAREPTSAEPGDRIDPPVRTTRSWDLDEPPVQTTRSWNADDAPVEADSAVASPAPVPGTDLWSTIADSHVLEREHRPEPAPPPSPPVGYAPAPPSDNQTSPTTGRRARNTALIILARVAIGLAIFAGFAVYRNITTEETVTVAEMVPGTCLQDPGPGLVGNAPVVDCANSHDLEVFALVQLPFADDAPLPEEEALFDSAFQACLPRFESYTGQDWDSSPYYLDAFVPDRHSWKNGDREAICFLFQVNMMGDLTSSTGSARRTSI